MLVKITNGKVELRKENGALVRTIVISHAIDADLNSGLISQEDAIERRERIGQESEFYGAMDGTIWNGVGLEQSKEKIKSRALNLKSHYDALTGDAVRK